MITLEPRTCALCGPGAGKKVRYEATFTEEDLNSAVFSARRMPDRRHFRLVECETCGMIFSDPACAAATLDHLYKHSEVSYGKQEEQIYDSYVPLLDRALAKVKSRGTFVEIGGGSGFMLRYGAAAGFARQIEIEPSADAERRFTPPSPDSRFIRAVFEKGLLPPGSASLVCFFQMLDHVPDPRGFLESVRDLLEPGGVALCVTHNTRAVSARLLGERSPIYDIEHTYLFHPENLSSLFERAGLAETEAFPISNRYAARYWLHLAPLPKPLKGGVSLALQATRLADARIPLRAGNFAVIGRRVPEGGP